LGAKCHAAISGKYSPDIDDVKAVAKLVLNHRVVRNYKAEAMVETRLKRWKPANNNEFIYFDIDLM
jgi:Mg-chelatase subunit ChlI